MSTEAGLTLGIEIEFLLIGRKDASDLIYTTADPTKPLTAIKKSSSIAYQMFLSTQSMKTAITRTRP